MIENETAWHRPGNFENVDTDKLIHIVANSIISYVKHHRNDKDLKAALSDVLDAETVIKQLAKIKTIAKTTDIDHVYVSDVNGHMIRSFDLIRNVADSITNAAIAKLKDDGKIMQVGRGRGLCIVVLNDDLYTTDQEVLDVSSEEEVVLPADSINGSDAEEDIEWADDRPPAYITREGGPNSNITYIADVKSSLKVLEDFVSDIEVRMNEIDNVDQMRQQTQSLIDEIDNLNRNMHEMREINKDLEQQLESSRSEVSHLEARVEELRYSTWS